MPLRKQQSGQDADGSIDEAKTSNVSGKQRLLLSRQAINQKNGVRIPRGAPKPLKF